MSLAETRTHIILPTELLQRVDRLVGARKRSRFFAAAVAKEAARLELLEAARAAAGSLRELPIPGWATAESIAAWVHDLRQADLARDEMLEQLRGETPTPRA